MPWKPVEIEAGRLRRRCSIAVIGVDRVAEREARREVERDRHGRLLALMVDLQRPTSDAYGTSIAADGASSRYRAVPAPSRVFR